MNKERGQIHPSLRCWWWINRDSAGRYLCLALVCMYVCMYVYACVCMYMYACLFMYVCVYVYACVCMCEIGIMIVPTVFSSYLMTSCLKSKNCRRPSADPTWIVPRITRYHGNRGVSYVSSVCRRSGDRRAVIKVSPSSLPITLSVFSTYHSFSLSPPATETTGASELQVPVSHNKANPSHLGPPQRWLSHPTMETETRTWSGNLNVVQRPKWMLVWKTFISVLNIFIRFKNGTWIRSTKLNLNPEQKTN